MLNRPLSYSSQSCISNQLWERGQSCVSSQFTVTCRSAALSFPSERHDKASPDIAGYSFVSRAFHWLTALLVLGAFLLSVGGPEARVFSDGNKDLLTLHESLGTTIFATTVLRLAHRRWARPSDPVAMPVWMHRAALATRVLFYSLLLLLPVSAIVGSWTEGHPLSLYAFGGVGSPWATSHAFGQSILSFHKLAGDAIMWLAGVHAAAALFHHFILKDNVLRSMLVTS